MTHAHMTYKLIHSTYWVCYLFFTRDLFCTQIKHKNNKKTNKKLYVVFVLNRNNILYILYYKLITQTRQHKGGFSGNTFGEVLCPIHE